MMLTIKRDKDNPLEAPTTRAVPPASALGEINKRVAGNFMATKLFSDTVKKGLKFFFSLRGRACMQP
jgi:hypothetical protein